MIKNIVFDMGNVLIKFIPKVFIETVGVNNPDDVEILLREVYGSVEWAMTDRGTLSEKEACSIMQKRVPDHLKMYVSKLTCDWARPLLPVNGAKEICKELKENGYRLYLLSNASLKQKEYWHDIPGSEYFDGEVVSSYVKLVKPQSEIYKCLLDKYGLKAEECVFIDDSILNVEGAVHLGFKGIVFHGDYKEVRKKLIELGVRVND